MHAARRQNLHVMIRHMNRMRRKRPFRQHSKRIQILHRRHAAMLLFALVELEHRLRDMDMQLNPILFRHFRAFAQRLFITSIDGMRRNGQLDAFRQRVAAIPQFLAFLYEHVTIRRRIVEEHADGRPQARFLHGANGSRQQKIHIVEIDRARMDHLHAGQTRPPVDVLLLQFGLRWPDMVVQPIH